MNTIQHSVRLGVRRGWLEARQMMTNREDLFNTFLFPAIFVIVMFFMRGAKLPGTEFSLGAATVPSVLGASIVFSGMLGMAGVLAVEREDGTLLRAKATPNGMIGYLVGKVVTVSLSTVIGMLLVLIPSLILFDGIAPGGLTSWLGLLWVLVIGLLATMPIGAIFGSLTSNARSIGLIMLPTLGIGAISGIFYPITALPEWLQYLGQVFPMYWLGLGMRSALLPDSTVIIEIGQSWRPWETLGVLSVWAVIGLTLAPVVLRRMARRESGSSVAARREKAMQRIG
ncbi:ABC transporter permease [Amycolatopsis sp. WAC 04169]|uniref:ABC transporter permease n=1 Tax=Amycolatopsis TaxID=1813 RepID=UPI00087D8281|nr:MULTISPECIES: ABC transporter permease [Amycolatopsis]OLZ44255.1 ABC transporter [Amycolatopsis keratiniphila subsp. nogabecina]RSN29944.1 ABC transporter permease [Amycolatopsis sp. WAC 04169]SDU43124.1 ABC-2 type transport system permease protein [Amycolatopsis keratiniphila]